MAYYIFDKSDILVERLITYIWILLFILMAVFLSTRKRALIEICVNFFDLIMNVQLFTVVIGYESINKMTCNISKASSEDPYQLTKEEFLSECQKLFTINVLLILLASTNAITLIGIFYLKSNIKFDKKVSRSEIIVYNNWMIIMLIINGLLWTLTFELTLDHADPICRVTPGSRTIIRFFTIFTQGILTFCFINCVRLKWDINYLNDHTMADITL